MPEDFVAEQLRSVLSDMEVDVVSFRRRIQHMMIFSSKVICLYWCLGVLFMSFDGVPLGRKTIFFLFLFL